MWEYRKPERLLFEGAVQKSQPNQEALKQMKTHSEMKLFQKKKAPVLSSRYIDPDMYQRNCLFPINWHGRRWAHISAHKSLEPYQKSVVFSHSRRSQSSSFEVTDQVKQWCQVARFRVVRGDLWESCPKPGWDCWVFCNSLSVQSAARLAQSWSHSEGVLEVPKRP